MIPRATPRAGVLLMLPFLLAAPSPRGAVEDSAEHGFTVRTGVEVSAAPLEVYGTFVERVGSWWDPAHTFFGDAGRLSMEARPGGCFCERGEGRQAVEHLAVVFVDPGRQLRLRGGLGPLQGEALEGSMTVSFAPLGEGGSTRVELVYRVGGYAKGGVEAFAVPVDRVLTELLQRLKRYVETGTPTAS